MNIKIEFRWQTNGFSFPVFRVRETKAGDGLKIEKKRRIFFSLGSDFQHKTEVEIRIDFQFIGVHQIGNQFVRIRIGELMRVNASIVE